MPRYKGFVFLLLCMNISLADVTGVAFCELAHSESQQHTLKQLQSTYQVNSCEALFKALEGRRGVLFEGMFWLNRGEPMTDITPICAMRHLKVINLNYVAIKDIACIANMQLEQFSFHNDADIEIDIRPLGKNTSLKLLILYGSPVKDFSPLSQLVNLEFLDLGWRNMEDTAPLAYLKKLEVLKLNGNPLKDLRGLSQLTQLRQLELGNTGMNDADLEHLRPLVNLGSLDVYENNLTDISALEDLTNLWQLIISQNQIVDLSPLAGMKRLTTLKANDNQIEDITPISHLPLLHTIEMRHNQVKDASSFINLPSLVTLNMRENPLYACSPSYKWDINAGKHCTEADLERLSKPSLWQRFKNWLGMA